MTYYISPVGRFLRVLLEKINSSKVPSKGNSKIQ